MEKDIADGKKEVLWLEEELPKLHD